MNNVYVVRKIIFSITSLNVATMQILDILFGMKTFLSETSLF